MTLEVVKAAEGQPRFEARDGLAYSHRGEVSRLEVERLRRVIAAVHPDALPLVQESA